MRRSSTAIGVALALLCFAPAPGAEPAELRGLFPHEADVFVDRGGLSRLVLPPEVLARCRPDLSDLRLVDDSGRETPFLVDRVPRDVVGAQLEQGIEAQILDARRDELRRSTGPALRRQTFELGMPAGDPPHGPWTLVVQPRRSEFVARMRVEGIGPDGDATPLIEDGSLFRLERPRAASRTRVPLPAFDGPRLRVTLETREPFWLEPAFRFERARFIERGGRVTVPMEVDSIVTADGTTVASLVRPRGIVPDGLQVATSTGTFDRRLEVWDEGPGSRDRPLAEASVFRVEALAPVEVVELDLDPARGDRLRVEIDDGDSPALADLSFRAVVRQPSLIFTLPEPDGRAAAGVLWFGGGRARAPRYDLAGLLASDRATGARAEAAAQLYDPASVAGARLGTPRPNPDFDREPPLAFAMRPGARIDRAIYSHVRPLRVPASPEGLSRLLLAPADLARVKEDLADLRVADAESRQWPYLVDRDAAVRLVPVEIQPPRLEDHSSTYGLRLPVERMRVEQVVLDCHEPYFDRAFRLSGTDGDGQRQLLAEGRIHRPVGDPRPVRIDVRRPIDVGSLELVVEDGDDASLLLRTAHVRLSLPALYLTAAAGEYTLLLGAPGEESPSYELERVRDVVLAVRSATVDAGELEQNPDFSLQARLRAGGVRQQVLLWVVLIAALVFLTVATLRLARRDAA